MEIKVSKTLFTTPPMGAPGPQLDLQAYFNTIGYDNSSGAVLSQKVVSDGNFA